MADKPEKTSEIIGPDAPVSKLTHEFVSQVPSISQLTDLSPWEICEAWANACGQVLAQSKDMPRETAMDRFDSLREIMAGAYDLYDIQGEA